LSPPSPVERSPHFFAAFRCEQKHQTKTNNMSNNTKEERIERAQIVRLYEASCNTAQPAAEDMHFRKKLQCGVLLRDPYAAPTNDEETLRARAHLLRLFEANSALELPSAADIEFRHNLHREIDAAFGLSNYPDLGKRGTELKGEKTKKGGVSQ
jgi:hypothetical protein